VIYQVYPRSFQDSDADGVGDLRGIVRRLDYLVALGVDAVWVSPIYPSPMADFGYDVADYTAVDALFGTMADFDALLAGCHARGLKLILDFVPNHTSDQHPWFVESRSSRTSAKRDWYLWRDTPNNWMSNFGGTAWTLDEGSGQYYYHSFLPQQPDLNWWNPEVRAAMYAAMRFWLAKGVDGFRLDVLWLLIKDRQFRDNLPNPDFKGGSSFWSVLPTWTADQPETHAIVREMRRVLDEFGDRVLIGEIYLDIDKLVTYYADGAQLPFNFHLIQSDWKADVIAALIRQYEAALPAGAWPNWVMGNHDQHRLATRVGAAQARVAAVLLLTLRGTPTMYYGDELGMPDAAIAPEQVVDPAELRQPGQGFGRDPERSPMLWDGSAQAGFTAGTPWLPLVTGWEAMTVAAQGAGSLLSLYRELLGLRRERVDLHAGAVSGVVARDGALSYVRGGVQVHLNMTGETVWVPSLAGKALVSTSGLRGDGLVRDWIELLGDEAVVVEIRGA
jgi:alpha-glucosidase